MGNPPYDVPLPNTVLIFRNAVSTAEVLRVRTDSAGNYAASLPAGTFTVDISNPVSPYYYNVVQPAQIVVIPPTPQQLDVKFVAEVP